MKDELDKFFGFLFYLGTFALWVNGWAHGWEQHPLLGATYFFFFPIGMIAGFIELF